MNREEKLSSNKKNRILFFGIMLHSAAKNAKGRTLWELLTYILLQNIKKLEDLFETLENFRKKSNSAGKNRKG